MRIPINLASEPFRRDRPLIVAGVAGAVILLITLGGLLLAIGTGRGPGRRNSRGRREAQFAGPSGGVRTGEV